ncbi:MAG: GH1 family beta-glucosidase [Candidatus Eisenbacteria bacterium]
MTEPGRFPPGFVWGAATSAYQIEGSPLADGAGVSNWHRFSHTPGRTVSGAGADTACDHYQRWREDVELMKSLGLQSYRFSVSWSRVLPQGQGPVNTRGLDFYDRLTDALIEAGVAPNLTLYHWDLPAALDDLGGWLNPDIVNWFADYAHAVGDRLGDRVAMWATLNEPWVISHDGYVTGCNAPGHRNLFEASRAARHLMLAHGAGIRALRATGVTGRLGLVVNLEPKDAATASAADAAAVERADIYFNRQFLEPALRGHWPDGLAEIYGEAWPPEADRGMANACEPLDWLGINYYTRKVVADDPHGWLDRVKPVPVPGALLMETGWEVHAPSFERCLVWVKERYGNVPLYVTENGAAFPDPPRAERDRVSDPLRVEYLRQHLLAVRRAMDRGVDVRGYFAWSLMDNLEWSAGFTRRFGLVHVDFDTQVRTLKDSAAWYREVIRTNGASISEAERAPSL